MQDMEQAIRERAYYMWNEAGRPHGHAEGFWLKAQREMLSQSLDQIASTTTTAAPKKTAKPKSASPRKRKVA